MPSTGRTNNTITYSLTRNRTGGSRSMPRPAWSPPTRRSTGRETAPAARSPFRPSPVDGSTQTQSFNIAINDLDEFDVTVPTDTDAAANEVDEDATVGTSVGITATACRLRCQQQHDRLRLDDDAGGRFAIDGSTGEITVNAALDYESSTSHSVTVRATSGDGSFTTTSSRSRQRRQ